MYFVCNIRDYLLKFNILSILIVQMSKLQKKFLKKVYAMLKYIIKSFILCIIL